MNPLNWNGTFFLITYVPFLVATYIAARIWRWTLNVPFEAPSLAELRGLGPYEVAVLEDPDSAITAAVGALVHEGGLNFEEGTLSTGKKPRGSAEPLERAIYAAVAEGVTKPGDLRYAGLEEIQRLEEVLRGKGLLMEREQAARYKKMPRLLFMGALAAGAAKVVVGMMRDKPVVFLVLILLVGGLVGWVSLSGVPRRTRRGDEALRRLREEHEALRMSASSEGAQPTMSGANVAMAVALFGTGMLAYTGVDGLRSYLLPPGSGGGGGVGCGGDYDSSYDSSSCGGDSGGGDSGCGGGGCGGCGGGD